MSELTLNIKKPRDERGISLLESLVAIVVMALGILGILGVQLRTLNDTQTGVRRAQAIRLIEDLSERTKVNPNALVNINNYITGWDTDPVASKNCTEAKCSQSELASYDLSVWKKSVKSALPLGNANVFYAADETAAENRRQLGVMVGWRENETATISQYKNPLDSSKIGNADVECPTGLICHLQYIQLSSRCAPYSMDASVQLFCATAKP